MRDGFVKVAASSPRIALANCAQNAKTAAAEVRKAEEMGVHLLVFPEFFLTGASCGDLFFQSALQAGALVALRSLCESTAKTRACIVIGLPIFHRGKLINAAAVLQGGVVLGIVPKTLPTKGGEETIFGAAPKLLEYIRLDGFEYLIPFGARLIYECQQMQSFSFAVEIGDAGVYPGGLLAHYGAGAAIVASPYASFEDTESAGRRRDAALSLSALGVGGAVICGAGEGESTTDGVCGGHNLICENGALLSEAAPFGGGFAASEIDTHALFAERAKKGAKGQGREDYFIISFDMDIKETTLTRKIEQNPFVPACAAARKISSEVALSIQSRALATRVAHIGAKAMHIGVSGGLDSALALMVCVRAAKELNMPRSAIHALGLPCFGTSERTRTNARRLCDALGVYYREIDITAAVAGHFEDIGHSGKDYDAAYENAQARERTQVLMDLANMENGLVIGPGDLSELALGWTTYGGDHMSMYAVNLSVPKTMVRSLLLHIAEEEGGELAAVLRDIVATPVSPELLPPVDGEISQKTEEAIGPYELHDFFIYYGIYLSFAPAKVRRLCAHAFGEAYTEEEIGRVQGIFYKRFFAAQFKRSCLPDGPKVTPVSLSPRGDYRMPSDAKAELWLEGI